jgi:hypothetical protein
MRQKSRTGKKIVYIGEAIKEKYYGQNLILNKTKIWSTLIHHRMTNPTSASSEIKYLLLCPDAICMNKGHESIYN